MPHVTLAPAVVRWLGTGDAGAGERRVRVAGDTVRAALDDLFASEPKLRGYLVDDHGALRHHVAVFVDGAVVSDKTTLATPLADGAEVYVMQALSGG